VTYFLPENAPAYTNEHSMQMLQAIFNEQSLYLLYEPISNNHKILPHGRDFYYMCSYIDSQGKFVFISPSHMPYLPFLYPFCTFTAFLLMLFHIPLICPFNNNQLKKKYVPPPPSPLVRTGLGCILHYFNIFPDVHVLSESKHTHIYALLL
jgi:hypothetical protein